MRGWRFGVIVLGMAAIVISQYFSEIKERKRVNWPQTKGMPKGTRVITEAPTRQFPITV
jgi:hypothetical protein